MTTSRIPVYLSRIGECVCAEARKHVFGVTGKTLAISQRNKINKIFLTFKITSTVNNGEERTFLLNKTAVINGGAAQARAELSKMVQREGVPSKVWPFVVGSNREVEVGITLSAYTYEKDNKASRTGVSVHIPMQFKIEEEKQ
ncbi:MAG: hypothetical protein P0S95_00275 [Rhabdochlamydiaceae bacterium]|nr:hypothetical protein [Candidatus Amphrikana amoebophyrae]